MPPKPKNFLIPSGPQQITKSIIGLAVPTSNPTVSHDGPRGSTKTSDVNVIIFDRSGQKKMINNLRWPFDNIDYEMAAGMAPDNPGETIDQFDKRYREAFEAISKTDQSLSTLAQIYQLGIIKQQIPTMPGRLVIVKIEDGSRFRIDKLFDSGMPPRIDMTQGGSLTGTTGSVTSTIPAGRSHIKQISIEERLAKMKRNALSDRDNHIKELLTDPSPTATIKDIDVIRGSSNEFIIMEDGIIRIGKDGTGVVIDTNKREITMRAQGGTIDLNTDKLRWQEAPFNDNLVSTDLATTDYHISNLVEKHELFARQEAVGGGGIGLLPPPYTPLTTKLWMGMASFGLSGVVQTGYTLNTVIAAMGSMESAPFDDITAKMSYIATDRRLHPPHVSSLPLSLSLSVKAIAESMTVDAAFLVPNVIDELIATQSQTTRSLLATPPTDWIPDMLDSPPACFPPVPYAYSLMTPNVSLLSSVFLNPEITMMDSKTTMAKLWSEAATEVAAFGAHTHPVPDGVTGIPVPFELPKLEAWMFAITDQFMGHTHICHQAYEYHIAPRLYRTYPLQEIFKSRTLDRIRTIYKTVKDMAIGAKMIKV